MLLLAAELHDVPDDQEISGQLELFDQRQFALDLAPRLLAQFGIGAPVALARAFVRALAQERRHGFACRHGISRELVAQIFEA